MGEITYTKEEFAALPPAEQNKVFLKNVVVKGKGVVRRADGSIKYDNESLKGTYEEGVVA